MRTVLVLLVMILFNKSYGQDSSASLRNISVNLNQSVYSINSYSYKIINEDFSFDYSSSYNTELGFAWLISKNTRWNHEIRASYRHYSMSSSLEVNSFALDTAVSNSEEFLISYYRKFDFHYIVLGYRLYYTLPNQNVLFFGLNMNNEISYSSYAPDGSPYIGRSVNDNSQTYMGYQKKQSNTILKSLSFNFGYQYVISTRFAVNALIDFRPISGVLSSDEIIVREGANVVNDTKVDLYNRYLNLSFGVNYILY
jgi:hypothetical protein